MLCTLGVYVCALMAWLCNHCVIVYFILCMFVLLDTLYTLFIIESFVWDVIKLVSYLNLSYHRAHSPPLC